MTTPNTTAEVCADCGLTLAAHRSIEGEMNVCSRPDCACRHPYRLAERTEAAPSGEADGLSAGETTETTQYDREAEIKEEGGSPWIEIRSEADLPREADCNEKGETFVKWPDGSVAVYCWNWLSDPPTDWTSPVAYMPIPPYNGGTR